MQGLFGIFSSPLTTQVIPHINFNAYKINFIHKAPNACNFFVGKKKYKIIIDIDIGIRLI
jgi:hypothetical protein